MDQFNFVAIGVGDKRNDGVAALDWARFSSNGAARGSDLVASGDNVGHTDSNVAIGRPKFIVLHAVVVGQFQFSLLGVAAIA